MRLRSLLASSFLFPLALAAGCTGSSVGGFEGANDGECSDGIDNDEDGWTDCEDQDCAGASECADADTGQPPEDTGEPEDTGDPDAPPSDFQSGKYLLAAMEILPEEEGFDLDGDGEIDNKLPVVLSLLDFAVDDDMSREGINQMLADSIDSGDIVELFQASYADLELEYDLLVGYLDDDDDPQLDEEQSYDGDGEPYSRYHGIFLDQTNIALGPDDVAIPATFYPDEPAMMLPVAESVVEGTLDDDGTGGMLGGAIPVERLIDDVIEPLIPEEGAAGMSKKELLETIGDVLYDEEVSDIELATGERAISMAVSYDAVESSW